MAIIVPVKNNGVDAALKTLRQKTARAGVLKDARKRQEGFMKPGVERRIKKEEAKKNSRRRERNNY